MTTDLNTLALRVMAIPAPSKRILLYRDALVHAAQMLALPASAEDRDLRQRNTRAAAVRRFYRLSIEDRARVEEVKGVIG